MPSEDDDFSASLSLLVHELRTPANVVGGYLRMLQRDAEGLSERQRKMIDEAERSCQRLVAMIAELSEIQKLDADIIQLVQEPFDLFPLVQRIVDEMKKREEFEVGIELRGPSEGAPIRGDAARLESALSGIFRQYLRELPPPTTVVVNRQIDARQKRSAVIAIAERGFLRMRTTTAVSLSMRSAAGSVWPFRWPGALWSVTEEALSRRKARGGRSPS